MALPQRGLEVSNFTEKSSNWFRFPLFSFDSNFAEEIKGKGNEKDSYRYSACSVG